MALGILPRYGMARLPAWQRPARVRRRGGKNKVLILADSSAAIAAVKKAGRTVEARSRHLQKIVNEVAEIREEGGEVKIGWVKAHMGILGNEVTDVLAKNAPKNYPRTVMKNGCLGGIRQWARRRKTKYVENIRRAMGWRRKAGTNYCRLRGGKGIGK